MIWGVHCTPSKIGKILKDQRTNICISVINFLYSKTQLCGMRALKLWRYWIPATLTIRRLNGWFAWWVYMYVQLSYKMFSQNFALWSRLDV